jgi:amidophosphoribosyltransferase
VIGRLKGHMALGHNRYSTTGDTVLRNVQPLFADLDTGGFAVAHNGNLTNALTLRKALISSGAICQSTSDTEVILHLIARSQRRRIIERFIEAVRQIQGAYSLVCLTNDMLIGARDPIGIRPLVLGRLGSPYVLASESRAIGPSRCARPGPASSSTSISHGPTRSSAAATSTTSASRWACSSPRRRPPTPTW